MWLDGITAYLFALVPARVVLWPVLGGAGATLAVALREGRRRTVLNECLHEVRRPLQAIVLAASAGPGRVEAGSVEMAAVALARLEREINGSGEGAGPREVFALRPLVEAAGRRWREQARMRGKHLGLRWDAAEAAVEGDRFALAAALDNLIANALEHGGERIELAVDLGGRGVCFAVVDSGGARASAGGERSPFERLSGRARRGHGLRLVRRTAARHGGSFALHRGERGTSAVLELPLASRDRRGPGREPRRQEIVIRREGR